jgi:hypothetical protein
MTAKDAAELRISWSSQCLYRTSLEWYHGLVMFAGEKLAGK